MPRILILLPMVFLGQIVHAFPTYYDIAQHEQAQVEARQRNLPLAWLGGFPQDLSGMPQSDQAALEQMAMATLQNYAVVIFFDGRNMAPVPMFVHLQFHIQDDGPLPGGASWVVPKVVFTNPEMTKILGRVSRAQMNRENAGALRAAIQAIRYDPTALAVPVDTPTPIAPPAGTDTAPDTTSDATNIANTIAKSLTPQIRLVICLALLLLGFLWMRRRS